jgi:hypothetical protein
MLPIVEFLPQLSSSAARLLLKFACSGLQWENPAFSSWCRFTHGRVDAIKIQKVQIQRISSCSASLIAAIGIEGMPSGWGYDYGTVAADPTNHLAVDVCFASDGGAYGCDDTEDKIATFAINTSNGSQSTSSTFSNMTTTEVHLVDALAMAPGGKLLAVAGENGVQIFNFNPNWQATANTGLISTAPVSQQYAASEL